MALAMPHCAIAIVRSWRAKTNITQKPLLGGSVPTRVPVATPGQRRLTLSGLCNHVCDFIVSGAVWSMFVLDPCKLKCQMAGQKVGQVLGFEAHKGLVFGDHGFKAVMEAGGPWSLGASLFGADPQNLGVSHGPLHAPVRIPGGVLVAVRCCQVSPQVVRQMTPFKNPILSVAM